MQGRRPGYVDTATNGSPQEVCGIFPRAEEVGAHFGVVIVREFGHFVEVATVRTEGVYTDGRHPDSVEFATAEEDAMRRDFTINGMFFDVLKNCVIDHVGGQEDLRGRIIQAIGHPERRFDEDHLRMLRAVRFAARLGFEIEQETFEAIYNRADKIRRVSAERIREELEKILTDRNRADGFDMLRSTGLLPHLWQKSQWSTELAEKSKRALAALPEKAGFSLAFATMLYHLAAKSAHGACRHLTCSNKVRTEVQWLINSLGVLTGDGVKTLADLKLLMAGPCFGDLCSLLRASLIAEDQPLEQYEGLCHDSAAIAPGDVAPTPLINGDDLIRMNVEQGPVFKRVLADVYYRQPNLELTNRSDALAWSGRRAEASRR